MSRVRGSKEKMSDEQTPVEAKKKRKYTRRAPCSIKAEGKIFRGIEIKRDGKFLILKTAKGWVFVNTETARTPIEITGTFEVGPSVTVSNTQVVSSPNVTKFKADRDRSMEKMMEMPGQFDVEG